MGHVALPAISRLKDEAKRLTRSLRKGLISPEEVGLPIGTGVEQISRSAVLNALARRHGFANWASLKSFKEGEKRSSSRQAPPSLLPTMAERIRALGPFNGESLPEALLLEKDGAQAIYYAPFDYTNSNARLVIVGLTPGRTQAVNALNACYEALLEGALLEEAAQRAKNTGSFSGSLRANLVAQLNHFGISEYLGVDDAAALFDGHGDRVQFTSVLRFPVFNADGSNYSGRPFASPMLQRLYQSQFLLEARLLRQALFLPLGRGATEAVLAAVAQGVIARERVLDGLVHPSGANQERINYQLGRKPRTALSAKTNADAIDAGSARVREQMAVLRGRSIPQVAGKPPVTARAATQSIGTEQESPLPQTAADLVESRSDGFPRLKTTVRLSEVPGLDDSSSVWVPVARDMTFFGPHVKLKKGYLLGRPEERVVLQTFDEALRALRGMAVPRWRRPSETTSVPGTVAGTHWIKLPRALVKALRPR